MRSPQENLLGWLEHPYEEITENLSCCLRHRQDC